MRPVVPPATRRRDLSAIAYGFMASKALFAGLEIGLFAHLSGGPLGVAELAARSGVAPHRMRTLVRALAAVGLLVEDGERCANAPAAQHHLAGAGLGEYYRLQVGRQIYPALTHLDAGIAGTGAAFDTLGGLLADPEQARTFTAAQHGGSLDAARVLADRLALGGATRLLDVGGGSGAFAIALCRRNPGLHATVLDHPAVVAIAREYRDEAGLAERIDTLDGDAVRSDWPPDQNVVLMSYLLSALGEAEIDTVLAKARTCLRPGGLLIVHDFMLDDDGPGPTAAALWFLQYLAYSDDAVSFTAAELTGRLHGAGFAPEPAEVLIPEITRVVTAQKRTSR
jgi:2-hydroxy-4-(methylsulfanyl)butanoate S-methyltransferase